MSGVMEELIRQYHAERGTMDERYARRVAYRMADLLKVEMTAKDTELEALVQALVNLMEGC